MRFGAGDADRRGAQRSYAFSLVLVWITVGCAQVESPSGGPVDRESPRVAGISPDSASSGVWPDTISILFSKKMNRNSVRDWTFLHPPLPIEKKEWDGNRLDLILAGRPDTETTYSILLGAEVLDQRGNSLGPWQSFFSTGSAIDDGTITGNVRSGRLRSGGVYLFLWPWSDSLTVGDGLPVPLRMGQAEKDGSFRLGAIPRERPLRLCALYDINHNRGYDPEEDLLGCLEKPLRLDDTTLVSTDLEIYLVLPDEPGGLSGTVIDSSCVMRGTVVLEKLAWEADSLTALIDTVETVSADSLLGFGVETEIPVDTTRVLSRLAELDSLSAEARIDSARCAPPIVVRLFEGDTTLVAETRGDGAFTFRDVWPGMYRIRAFRDADEDGSEDPGETAGTFRFPIELKPGRELKDLDLYLREAR